MFALLVGAQLLTFAGMVAVSVWGWKHLAPEARVRARIGTTGLDWTMSKNTTLVLTPLVGVWVVVATLVVPDPPNRQIIAALGLAVMMIFLAAHWSSTRRAAR